MYSAFFNAFSRNVLIVLLFVSITLANNCSKDSNGKECGPHGICQFGECYCRTGYFGDDCSEAIIDSERHELIVIQVVFGAISLAKLVFAIFGLYAVLTDRNGTIALLSNIRMYLFGIFTTISLVELVYNGVDPLAQWGIFSPLATSLLYAVNYPLAIAAFVALLFHWIEVLNVSISSLNKEYHLKRISRNYKGQVVTLEGVVDRVRFLKKLQLPFLILTAVAFAAILSFTVAERFTKYPRIFYAMKHLIMVIAFGSLSVGYLVYGKRLAALMPAELTRRVKKISLKLVAFCIWIVIAMIAFIVSSVTVQITSARVYLTLWVIGASIRIITELAVVSIFLYVQPTFPYITFNLSADLELARRRMTKTSSYDINLQDLTISVIDLKRNTISPVESYDSNASGATVFTPIPN